MNKIRYMVLLMSVLAWGMPARAEPAADELPLSLAVDLADGSRLVGVPGITSLSVQTAYARLEVELKHVRTLTMEPDRELAVLEMRNGDRLKGGLLIRELELKTAFGNVKLGADQLVRLRVSSREQTAGLVFWNKLGSLREIENSEAGPGGTIFGQGVSFVPGKFGNGFTSGPGKSGPNFGPWEKINPNFAQAGAVEFWWKPARPFDAGNTPPDEIFVSGKWEAPVVIPFHLMYRWRESERGIGGFNFQVVSEGDLTQRYLYTGKKAPFRAGEWVHVAFVWDMNGLPHNPAARYTVFVNGREYPLVDSKNPEAKIDCRIAKRPSAYFAMGYYDADWNNQMQGVLDNVKIWNYPKTDYDDREEEGAPVAR